MPQSPVISEAEWPIMVVLWEKGSATAGEIALAVTRDRDVSMRTVKTHIRRLIAKKAVGYSMDPQNQRLYHYRHLITREQAVKIRNNAYLGNIRSSTPLELLDAFVADGSLSDDEIAAIQQLLQRKRREKDGSQ